jgi:hypothetical protein
MVDSPTESLRTELLPTLHRIWNVFLNFLLISSRLSIKISIKLSLNGFYLTSRVLLWTGLFTDIDPAVDKLPEYRYEALKTHRHIRLLEISRRYPFGPIRCRMFAVHLDELPTYECNLYTWGDPAMIHNINVGRSLPARSDGQCIRDYPQSSVFPESKTGMD